MATIGDKKVSLALQDGSSINLNKPKVLPADITSFTQITEPGFYRGGLIYTGGSAGSSSSGGPIGSPSSVVSDKPVVLSADSNNGIAVQATAPGANLSEQPEVPEFDDSEINYVITDGPDGTDKYFGQYGPNDAVNKYTFDLLVVPDKSDADSASYVNYKNKYTSYTFILFVCGAIYTARLYHQIYFTTDDAGNVIENTDSTRTSVTAWTEAGGSTISIINSLTSTDSTSALSAAQGKVLNESKMNAPIYSSADLTPGVSKLDDGQIYIVYYN